MQRLNNRPQPILPEVDTVDCLLCTVCVHQAILPQRQIIKEKSLNGNAFFIYVYNQKFFWRFDVKGCVPRLIVLDKEHG